MFTIKHIDRKNTEHLIDAVEVWYKDNSEEVSQKKKVFTMADVKRQLHYTTGPLVNGGRLSHTLNFGLVYVMNSNGKTVATYNLGDE
jgi:hypothetical protein